MRSAYGRMSSMRVCARLSFAAATSSSARVIFRVFRTDLTRRLMSWTVAIVSDERVGLLDMEGLLDLLDLRVELRSELVREVAALPDLFEDRAVGAQVLDRVPPRSAAHR